MLAAGDPSLLLRADSMGKIPYLYTAYHYDKRVFELQTFSELAGVAVTAGSTRIAQI